MTDARSWLDARANGAPDRLRERMNQALTGSNEATIADELAAAAESCLRAALKNPSQRASALDLLAADALLTHACEAAAEQGGDALARFAESWNAERFEQLL
jgi:hypothetical protein